MKSKFFNRIYRFNQTYRDEWIEQQAKQLPQGTKILDIGAGTCRYRNYFDHCDYNAHDFAQLPENSIEYGKFDFKSDILEIPVQNSSFDCVLCTEVLEHTPEPIKVIQVFSRVLREGGRLILTAPLCSGIHQSPYFFYGGFSPYWYTRFLAESGFSDIKIVSNGNFFRFFGQESQRFASCLMRIAAKRRWLQLIIFPFLILLKIIFAGLIPLICHWIDKNDSDSGFTVGYHVTAVRNRDNEAGLDTRKTTQI